MQNIVLSLFINAMMAGLLLATIIYCLRLNSRIKVLQDSKSELARIIREFDESTTRATQSIAEIHKATNRISENIQHKIDRANFLADDLHYMIEKGNKLTGKTDNSPIRPARSPQASSAAEPVVTPFRPQSAPAAVPMSTARDVTQDAPADIGQPQAVRRPLRMRSRAEQELMSALGNKNTGESGR